MVKHYNLAFWVFGTVLLFVDKNNVIYSFILFGFLLSSVGKKGYVMVNNQNTHRLLWFSKPVTGRLIVASHLHKKGKTVDTQQRE